MAGNVWVSLCTVINYRMWVMVILYGLCFGVELTMNNIIVACLYDQFDLPREGGEGRSGDGLALRVRVLAHDGLMPVRALGLGPRSPRSGALADGGNGVGLAQRRRRCPGDAPGGHQWVKV